MRLLSLLFFFQSYFTIVSKYIFSNTQDFLSQLSNASIDELVYILTKLEKEYGIRNYESPEKKYSADRPKLLLDISKIMDEKKINSETLSVRVLKDQLKRTASEEIETSEWYQKVIWVINADLYYLRMQMRKPQLGGIIDYVNYLNKDQLNQYLYDLLQKIPSFEEDYSLFEKEIINRKPFPEDLIQYLENQNITTLNEWGVRIYLYFKLNDIPKCNEIGDVFNISNPQQAFLYINKFLSSLETTKDYDNFFKYIVYNNHSFPLLMDTLKKKPIGDIKLVSKYVESYHRKATKNSQSFDHLHIYISKIPKHYLMEYIINESKTHPELNEENRAKDLNQIQTIASLSNVNNMLMKMERDVILRWAFNIYHYFDSSEKSSINQYIYSQSTERILEELMNYLKKKTVDYSINEISKLGESKNDTEEFLSLLSCYPPVIQKKWLIKLQEHHQTTSNSPASTVDLQNPSEIKENLFRYIIIYKFDRASFVKLIDNQDDGYTLPYGNYATFFYSIKTKELLVWLRKVEEFIKSKKRLTTIMGGIKFFDDSNIKQLDKVKIVEQLLTYIELFPELKDIKVFDEVIGMYRIHLKIHNADIHSLNQYVIALRKYHDIKLIQYKTSESDERDINNFISSADQCHIKLYILRILVIFPELNIDSVWNTVIELGKDFLNTKYDQNTLFEYLNELPKEKLVYYCKQCSRYTNALKQTYIQDDCLSKDKSALLWNTITIVFGNENEILKRNINFYRLMTGSEEMIYGGLEPFIFRQPIENLDLIITNLPIQLLDNEAIDRNALLNVDRNSKIEKIMSIIYKNNLIDLKMIDDYLDTSKTNKELYDLSKTKLGKYSLAAEYQVRIQKGNQLLENYEIVSDKYLQMTKNELIRYILKANLLIDDLEIKSRMVLLSIGEIKTLY